MWSDVYGSEFEDVYFFANSIHWRVNAIATLLVMNHSCCATTWHVKGCTELNWCQGVRWQAYLFYKAISGANKASESADREDGFFWLADYVVGFSFFRHGCILKDICIMMIWCGSLVFRLNVPRLEWTFRLICIWSEMIIFPRVYHPLHACIDIWQLFETWHLTLIKNFDPGVMKAAPQCTTPHLKTKGWNSTLEHVDYEIVRLWDCEIVRLWDCEIVRLWSGRFYYVQAEAILMRVPCWER